MGKDIVAPVFIDFEHPAVMHAMILHILEHADIQGTDQRGRPVMHFEFPVEDWMIDKLALFGVRDEDLEPEAVEDGDEDVDEVPSIERVA
jgi:hypothetical protein